MSPQGGTGEPSIKQRDAMERTRVRLNNLAAVIFFAFGCLMITASVNLYYSLDAARAVVPFVLAGVAFFGAAASWKDARS